MKSLLRFFHPFSFRHDIVDRKVGRDQDGAFCQLRCLVFLVDGKAAFIAQCFQELDAQFVDVGMIHVFQHNVVMYLVVVEIKESVVQVFLVCPWIDIVHDGRLARARKSVEPDVWMMLDSRWFLLLDQCLYFFAVLEVVSWIFFECFVVFVLFEQDADPFDDVVCSLFLFFVASLQGSFFSLVSRQFSSLKDNKRILVNFGELFSVVSSPSRIRKIPALS